MLIDAISAQLLTARELDPVHAALASGEDATLSLARSARPLVLAALWARDPRPCLLVVSGEEAADRTARALAAWLGLDRVARYPLRGDHPWQDKAPDDAVVGARCQAVARLAAGEEVVVVASARALMRRVPPAGSGYYASSTFSVGDEVPFEDVPALLVGMGYVQAEGLDGPGTFHVHGDTVDVFPAQAQTPVRIEFFGDEIDRVRRMVASTGQTIGDLDEVVVSPCREMALTDDTVAHAERALFRAARDDTGVAADLEQISQRVASPALERYLGALYGSTASPIEHASSRTLVVLAEPRALFDDCQRFYDDVSSSARAARIPADDLATLYTAPREMSFGSQQRLTFSSMLRAGEAGRTAGAARAGTSAARVAAAGRTSSPRTGSAGRASSRGTSSRARSRGMSRAAAEAVASSLVPATSPAPAGPPELPVRQPDVAGSETKLLGRIRQLVADGYAIAFCVPDRRAREELELRLSDEYIPFEERLGSLVPEEHVRMLAQGRVTFADAPVPAGVVVPSARLAVLAVGDLTARSAKSRRKPRHLDPTSVTFPFEPGDYVVHAAHGIALFKAIVRQEVDGRERDYFQLEYAGGDRLYVPLEGVDRLTRYVGPDGAAPRLTRLHTADWSRAEGKARRSAKKLAFDLVDLYARRSTVAGHAFPPDTAAQEDMEADFPYELTDDQARALADIKADMEAPRPMDRLLCGDVGFGKTEVALRAAFKCCQDARQVMVLCPTTILAQQHFETFSARFRPYGVRVAVLSRFVTPAQQRRTLEDFAAGEVGVLIGTHRLLSSDVNPHDLGLVVIDEEQRFGVQHKEQLKNMREQVDVLTLSATPIPRTMQMAVSGVRDMSLILTPPPGRLPVKVVVGEWDADLVSAAIRRELARHGQVYYVSNRVRDIDEAVARVLEAAPEARVGVAHGKMSASEVEDVMLAFDEHETDVLVATTIIENGIDNAHTNTLIIEDSQRLGLSQLYQLKGRVGRGREQAYAYFMFPAAEPLTPEATERLMAINEYQDLGSGMRVAMRDLEIRGAGSLMGAEQHGNLSGVGFDLFTQMLGQAVAEARGETSEPEPPEVTLNLPADFYLAEEYLPEVDKRVLVYRRIAAATELADVDAIQRDCEESWGALPLAGRNLLDRARIRIRAQRLGVTSISLGGGRITFQGVSVPRDVALRLKAQGALNYPTSHRLAVPFRRSQEELLPVVLGVLSQLGGDDEAEG